MLKELLKEILKEELIGAPIIKEECNDKSVFTIGKYYLIRTVTMSISGKLTRVTPNEFVMSEASWVADTGRFNEFLLNPEETVNENEPFKNDVVIGRGALIDMTLIPRPLQTVK